VNSELWDVQYITKGGKMGNLVLGIALAIIISTSCGVGLLIGLNVPSSANYRKGQIDCINGKIFYKLVKTETKETVWKEK